MGQRHTHGYPIRNSDARAIDVVARLSGVNFGSVEKVFAAMYALQKGMDWDPRDMVNIHNCPTVAAHKDKQMSGARITATQRAVAALMRSGAPAAAYDLLMLSNRFRLDGSARELKTTDYTRPPSV